MAPTEGVLDAILDEAATFDTRLWEALDMPACRMLQWRRRRRYWIESLRTPTEGCEVRNAVRRSPRCHRRRDAIEGGVPWKVGAIEGEVPWKADAIEGEVQWRRMP